MVCFLSWSKYLTGDCFLESCISFPLFSQIKICFTTFVCFPTLRWDFYAWSPNMQIKTEWDVVGFNLPTKRMIQDLATRLSRSATMIIRPRVSFVLSYISPRGISIVIRIDMTWWSADQWKIPSLIRAWCELV